jgi:hypothetical protein
VNVLKNNTKCYIYTSVSTAIQVDGYSLDAQKDKLSKYAEFQDMEVVGEYYNEEHSGKSTNDAVNGVANYLNNHRYTKKLHQNGTISGFLASFIIFCLEY